MKKVFKNKKNGRRLLILLVAVFVVAIIIAGSILAFNFQYQDKFFPNVNVGKLNLGGLTKIEAELILDQITATIENDGLKVIYQDNGETHLKITPAISSLNDPDLSRQVLTFDNQKTIEATFAIGRDSDWLTNFFKQVETSFSPITMPAQVEINEAILQELLEQQFAELEQQTKNAQPEITWQEDIFTVEIASEQDGMSFNYSEVIETVKSQLENLDNSTVEIKKELVAASIKYREGTDNKHLIENVLTTTTPTLTYQNSKWPLKKYELGEMLEFQKINGEIMVGLNRELWDNWLETNISSKINVEPRDASLEINNGRATRFISHRNGQSIDIEKTYQEIMAAISIGNQTIELVVDVTSPNIVTADVNDLGITELIGSGQSNFAGSPRNRRHNIKVGAETLHGILIKPDEEFSLMQALGEIDATAGYLPELVIKGNETKPEYGGGLCQIGTTTFRAAIYSGLPITERRPHAYSVSYYLQDGKPGMDATIYSPHPDVRFVNDTGKHVLIQTYIDGNELVFEFWGTKDNREIKIGEISNWDWVKPEETKYVETLDLPVGKQKCTESSHWGVKASFDYNITYPDGQIKEETFYSKYRPWQAVCLIGVEKLSDDTASSTDETI